MRPFRVSWRFSQPICLSENRLHLDAILAWANVNRAIGNGASSPDALALQETLPLERVVGDSGQWIWKASSLSFTFSSPPFLVQCVRRTDIDTVAFARNSLIHTARTQLEKGTGPYKDFDLRFAVQWVESATAYGVGEIEAVGAGFQSFAFRRTRTLRQGGNGGPSHSGSNCRASKIIVQESPPCDLRIGAGNFRNQYGNIWAE